MEALDETFTNAPHQPDGDDQFEAVHQDIGRISGLNGGAQVAPKSTLVARPQQYQEAGSQLASPPVVAAAAAAAAIAQVFDRPASNAAPATPRTSRPLSGSSRKPNRITLVARRDPLPSPTSALVAAQLPAPSQLDAPASVEAPTYTPTFAAASPAPVALVEAQPAFRSFATAPAAVHSPTHSASVSARHSALMAQVAAERAAAQGLVDSAPILPPPPPPPPTQQEVAPSFANQAAAGQHLPQPHFVAQPQQQHHQPQAAPTSAQGQAVFLSQPEEPQVAPSFEHVLGHGCPHRGVYSWENRDHCDRYYMCTNGTFTEEACPNGLAYSQQGAVYQHCAYNWLT